MIKRFSTRKTSRAYWYSSGRRSRHLPAFSMYYGSNDWELLINTLANSYPLFPIFFWEAREDLSWPGSTEYTYFGAPYRKGCVPTFQLESQAVRGTSVLLPGGGELTNPCTVCNFKYDLMAGGCALFNSVCESRGDARWIMENS